MCYNAITSKKHSLFTMNFYRELDCQNCGQRIFLSRTGNSLKYFKYTKFRNGRCNGYDDHGNERIKETKGYTLEEIAVRSGVDIELLAKVFYKKEQIGQKELYIRRLLSRLRWLCGNISKIKVENVKCLCHRLMYSWIRMIRRWRSRMFFSCVTRARIQADVSTVLRIWL